MPRILSIGTLRTPRWSASTALAVVMLLSVLAVGVAQVKVFAVSVAGTIASVIQPARTIQSRAASVAPPSIVRNRQSDQPRRASQTQKPRTSPETTVPSTPIVPVDTASISTLPAPAPDDHIVAGQAPRPASTENAVASSPPSPPPRTSASPDDTQTPWGAAADAGTAVGRGSRKAGVATGSFFSRLGKKIAGSF